MSLPDAAGAPRRTGRRRQPAEPPAAAATEAPANLAVEVEIGHVVVVERRREAPRAKRSFRPPVLLDDYLRDRRGP